MRRRVTSATRNSSGDQLTMRRRSTAAHSHQPKFSRPELTGEAVAEPEQHLPRMHELPRPIVSINGRDVDHDDVERAA